MSDNEQKALSAKQIAAWNLRQFGYTIAETAKALGIGERTVSTYTDEVNAYMGEDPVVQAAKARMVKLLPKCVNAYEEIVEDGEGMTRLSAARDVAKTYGVIKDKTEHTHNFGDVSNAELVERFCRLVGIEPEAEGGSSDDTD